MDAGDSRGGCKEPVKKIERFFPTYRWGCYMGQIEDEESKWMQ